MPWVGRMQLVNFNHMQRIRDRIDEIVTDRATADALKPWCVGWIAIDRSIGAINSRHRPTRSSRAVI